MPISLNARMIICCACSGPSMMHDAIRQKAHLKAGFDLAKELVQGSMRCNQAQPRDAVDPSLIPRISRLSSQ
jgi:hypothetical protein